MGFTSKRTRLIRMVALIAAVVIATAIFLWPKDEPKVDGESLSAWLAIAVDSKASAQDHAAAREAIRF